MLSSRLNYLFVVFSRLTGQKNKADMMKAKEKQRQKLDTSKKRRAAESSSDEDEDSDAERNFALLAKREGANGEDCEDVNGSETGDEEEEEEDAEEEEAEGEGDAEAAASEEDQDSDDDDDDDEEAAGGSSEIQTREDVKKGELEALSCENLSLAGWRRCQLLLLLHQNSPTCPLRTS